jgi:hypothetical protein
LTKVVLAIRAIAVRINSERFYEDSRSNDEGDRNENNSHQEQVPSLQ